jgi:hypothetical protein
MAHPRIVDVGDSFQIWVVAAYILNKEERTAGNGWSSSLGVGRGDTMNSYKNSLLRNVI